MERIETAPKDGTRILVFGVQRGFLPARWFCARYDNDRWMGETGDGSHVVIPDYWVPLPADPSVSANSIAG